MKNKLITMLRFFFFLTCLMMHKNLFAQLKLAQIFSDNAILQRQKPIKIWGWASPNEKILVTLAGQQREMLADTEGGWQVIFDPLESGETHTLFVTNAKQSIIIKNILIGELWLCSGQSNMEWTVAQARYFAAEQNNADFPQIRHFHVQREVSLTPLKNLTTGHWQPCSPQTVGNFTAVGFFFARLLHQRLGVPVGIIHASWGGSHIEGWISRESLQNSPLFSKTMQHFPKNWAEADEQLDKKLVNQLFKHQTNFYPTIDDEKKYLNPQFDASDWVTSSPLGQWDWKGFWAFRGKAFLSKKIYIPKLMTAENTVLGLGENDSFNEIYLNGKMIFSGVLKGKRQLKLPPNTWQVGENQLVIKFGEVQSPNWFGVGIMGEARDMYVSCTKYPPLSIGGNDWKLMVSFAEKHHYAHLCNNVFSSIFNGMIAPLRGFSMRGFLWYQGESNVVRASEYREAFALLINDWREKWKDELPFFYVQLASYGDNQSSNQGSGWALLREAQTQILAMPKTGMAVTIDIGDANDIHPTNKQDVAKRLFFNILQNVYGQKSPQSPLLDTFTIRQDTAILSFRNIEKGLLVKDKYDYIRGFEVAGEDCIFHYAQARIVGEGRDKIEVTHPKKQIIKTIRYAWADAPIDANIFNSEDLPLCPFRTDK